MGFYAVRKGEFGHVSDIKPPQAEEKIVMRKTKEVFIEWQALSSYIEYVTTQIFSV